ncbi:MAG: GatB/YqeY domain-containing protein [Dehalococcoidia bacterium]|nr:GatB/YqeY domain-containing protein [Dehalococcoidia bacterium]
MALIDRLREDLNQALRKGDKTRLSAIRLLISNINNAQIAKGAPMDDGDVIAVMNKQAKQHRESIEAFRKGNRPDLVAKEEAELAIVLDYLPQQMSREEIVAAARKVIEEVGAQGPGEKGKVMSKLMPQLKGKAPGAEINAIVTELLSG